MVLDKSKTQSDNHDKGFNPRYSLGEAFYFWPEPQPTRLAALPIDHMTGAYWTENFSPTSFFSQTILLSTLLRWYLYLRGWGDLIAFGKHPIYLAE